jgi:hypothetical protein
MKKWVAIGSFSLGVFFLGYVAGMLNDYVDVYRIDNRWDAGPGTHVYHGPGHTYLLRTEKEGTFKVSMVGPRPWVIGNINPVCIHTVGSFILLRKQHGGFEGDWYVKDEFWRANPRMDERQSTLRFETFREPVATIEMKRVDN